MARREAIAGFNYQPKAIGTRALDNSLKDKVNNNNTAKVMEASLPTLGPGANAATTISMTITVTGLASPENPSITLSEKWSSQVDKQRA